MWRVLVWTDTISSIGDTNREWDVMRRHPQVGYDLLRKLPTFAGPASLVLAHHEAFDGTGIHGD